MEPLLQPRAAQPLPFRPAAGRGEAGLEGSAASPQSRSGRGPSPSRPPANRRGLRLARHPRGAAPLFVERRPGTYFLAGVRVLLPGVRRPLQVLRRRLPPHRTSSRRRRRRVPPPPPPPHHVSHPGLRHRVKRSWPAWVGAQRPARALRPRDQSAALRPARDTTPSGPGHRAPQHPPRPAASFRGPASPTHSEVRTPPPHPRSPSEPTGLC
ncbi:serine/arginine repetitive matrix protein 1-like [Panthera tigris]|uniref:serine/arginine repetitive matrix protein 1-like n=1 Tax=Panthera tigris TaxID=9694 RepID=UPI001C6F7162|nr:serine/arginine repetitive matrix protein 1-like [Panthera tigris]